MQGLIDANHDRKKEFDGLKADHDKLRYYPLVVGKGFQGREYKSFWIPCLDFLFVVNWIQLFQIRSQQL